MDLKEVRKAVSRIKTALFKNSNSYSVGMLKSHFRGTGLQFKEHRVYSFGDDVRFIDWKMLAKTNSPYVKTFEEERNVEIVVIIDATYSMFMGYEGVSKLQAAIEICCLLYLLAKETSDFVHAVILTERGIYDLPKKQGEAGIALLLARMEELGILDKKGKVDVEYPLRNYENTEIDTKSKSKLFQFLKRKKEIVLLSDMVDSIDVSELKKIIFNKNIHCFQLLCPLDEKKKVPFSVFSLSPGNKNTKGYFSINSSEQSNIENLLGKRLKKLNVEDRYLEAFIREMI